MRDYPILTFFVSFTILLFVAGAVFAYGYPVYLSSLFFGKALVASAPPIARIDLEENYKKYAANVVAFLSATPALEDEIDLGTIREAKETLLSLRVPRELTTVHLDLVLSVGLMESGLSAGDTSKYETGLKKLNKLIETNDWLKF